MAEVQQAVVEATAADAEAKRALEQCQAARNANAEKLAQQKVCFFQKVLFNIELIIKNTRLRCKNRRQR